MCETSYKAASSGQTLCLHGHMQVGRVPRHDHHRVKRLLSQMWANLTLIAKPSFTARSTMNRRAVTFDHVNI